MRDFWEFVIDLLPITFRSVSAVGLERPRGQNPRGRGQNPRGRGRGHNPRGRGQVFRPRGRGHASRPNIPALHYFTLQARYTQQVGYDQKRKTAAGCKLQQHSQYHSSESDGAGKPHQFSSTAMTWTFVLVCRAYEGVNSQLDCLQVLLQILDRIRTFHSTNSSSYPDFNSNRKYESSDSGWHSACHGGDECSYHRPSYLLSVWHGQRRLHRARQRRWGDIHHLPQRCLSVFRQLVHQFICTYRSPYFVQNVLMFNCPSLWPSGIGFRLGRNRLWVRFLAVSDIYPMFIEPTITWVPSGFSGYIWLDTKVVLKKKIFH